MRKFGLIGYPLGHSFSQKYFSEKFKREKICECTYENFPMKEIESLPGLIYSDSEICGLNVTIPYKTEILRFIDETDEAVKEIGAANVLKIKREEGTVRLFGYNSDIEGVKESLRPLSGVKGGKALILGTGGGSRAVAWTLGKMGFEVILVSRRKSNGILRYNEVSSEILADTDLIVNATPIGMNPHADGMPEIDYSLLDEHHTLFDLVYNPEMTSFLKMGQERGCRIITGIKMLYSQAERSWEIWNDDRL